MIVSGYDTDDLTNRQNYYFHLLNKGCSGNEVNMFAYSFLRSCVRMNFENKQFDNYEGDCDFLFRHSEDSKKFGINLDEVYA